MKKTIVSFLTCMMFALSAFAYCGSEKSAEKMTSLEKNYISIKQLHVSDEAMFVFLNNQWQQVDAVFSDNQGLFIARQPSPETWYCKTCRTYHAADQECPQEQIKKPR